MMRFFRRKEKMKKEEDPNVPADDWFLNENNTAILSDDAHMPIRRADVAGADETNGASRRRSKSDMSACAPMTMKGASSANKSSGSSGIGSLLNSSNWGKAGVQTPFFGPSLKGYFNGGSSNGTNGQLLSSSMRTRNAPNSQSTSGGMLASDNHYSLGNGGNGKRSRLLTSFLASPSGILFFELSFLLNTIFSLIVLYAGACAYWEEGRGHDRSAPFLIDPSSSALSSDSSRSDSATLGSTKDFFFEEDSSSSALRRISLREAGSSLVSWGSSFVGGSSADLSQTGPEKREHSSVNGASEKTAADSNGEIASGGKNSDNNGGDGQVSQAGVSSTAPVNLQEKFWKHVSSLSDSINTPNIQNITSSISQLDMSRSISSGKISSQNFFAALGDSISGNKPWEKREFFAVASVAVVMMLSGCALQIFTMSTSWIESSRSTKENASKDPFESTYSLRHRISETSSRFYYLTLLYVLSSCVLGGLVAIFTAKKFAKGVGYFGKDHPLHAPLSDFQIFLQGFGFLFVFAASLIVLRR